VLFTNYQFYIDEFVRLGREAMASGGADAAYEAFVEPGNVVERPAGMPAQPGDQLGAPLPRLPQMAAYHLKRADRSGITMVNIGSDRRTRRRSPTTSRCCGRTPG
jgi:AMP nucleosidase